MKLYYAPGACSLSPHILLRETGLPFTLEHVDLATKTAGPGEDFLGVNPKGKVPVLEITPGTRLTEGAVIAQYIVERAGSRELLPPGDDPARYRVLEWQTFVTTELHKTFSPLFNPSVDSAGKRVFATELRRKFEWVNGCLEDSEYLTGPVFTVADAYLYVVSRWARLVGLEIGDLSNLQATLARIGGRPAVRAALETEGLPA